MKRFILLFFSFMLINIPVGLAEESQRHSVIPKEGFVPDQNTAVQIAVAILGPIYGEEQIEKEKPFNATLKNEIWRVEGSLPKSLFENGIVLGGVAMVEISKKDARILWVSHGK